MIAGEVLTRFTADTGPLTAALKTASQQIDQATDEMKKLGFTADQVAVAQKAMSAEVMKGAMAFRQQNDVSAMAARSFAILRGETEQTEKSATRARAAFLPLAAAVQQSISLFKDMSPAMAAVTGAVDNMVFSILGAAAATGSWSAALRVLMGILSPWTIAIVAAGAALAYFVGKQKEAQKQTEDFRREWDRLNNATMQAETTTRQGAIQLDHLQEMAKIFSMKITEAQRNELIFKEQMRFGAEMTKLQREELEKAGEEAKKYAETVAAARDSLVGQIEAVRIQTKELEDGKDAAIDYEMSILAASDKVALLGNEGKKLVDILKEEKKAFEALKESQKHQELVLAELVKQGALQAKVMEAQTKEQEELAKAGEAYLAELEKEAAFAAKISGAIRKDLQDISRASQQVFEGLFDSITRGIEATLQGVMEGSQSLGEGMKNLARNMIMSFNQELLKLAVFNPIKNMVMGWMEGAKFITPGATTPSGGTTAPTLNLGGIGSSIGGFFSSIAGLLGFANGGIVPGMRGQPVPILAHAGERVIPLGQREGAGSQGNVQVKIMGDVVPREPTMRKEDVIQIGLAQFEDRSIWMQSLEQRMSRRS